MYEVMLMKLNDNEHKVLLILKEDPYISQKKLADLLNLSRPAVANLISGLQDKGYILGKPYVLREERYITCIGGANYDRTFKLEDDLILGTSNPVLSQTSFGGVIRNVAENLARLDQNVSLMSIVGNDTLGQELIAKQKKLMEVFATDYLDHETTGSYYSIIDQKGNMTVGFADMSINQHMSRSWILEHKRHIHLSSYIVTDLNVSKDAIESLLEVSKSEKIPLAIVGVSGPKMKHLPEDLDGLDLLICNLDEAQAYFKTKEDDPKILLQKFLEKNISKVVITVGTKGSYYGTKNQINHQNAYMIPDHEVVDVTGAGDAFSSALIYGLVTNHSFDESIRYAAINSSLTIQSNHSVNPKLSINLIKKELKKYENI
jgi:sugar/nucleoside kinase (ribokinase family)/DNA-binding CsgD family transcriptional regulator